MHELIRATFEGPKAEALHKLWDGDSDSREAIRHAILEHLRDSPVPKAAKLFDFVLCVCATFKPAESEEEVVIVSRMVCDVFTMVSPLPSLTECDTPKFCSKTMVSLALFHDHMVRRTERYGAPKPAYYRAVAKNRLNLTGRAAVAEHHEQWESFLGENLL